MLDGDYDQELDACRRHTLWRADAVDSDGLRKTWQDWIDGLYDTEEVA